MSVILGIDVGGSTTKIIGFREDKLIGTLRIRAADQVTSLFGAVGNFLHQHEISLDCVSSVILTGVGASFIESKIYGIDTYKVDEFQAMGHGGLYLADIKEAFVASLGTGTAFVRATPTEIIHIGGTGVGGGTLLGLASKMLNMNDIDAIISLAEKGNLQNVDLSVQEILNRDISSLPPNLTASNFGNIKSMASDADFALGIINMIFQTVGMLATFASRNDTIKNMVLTGTLTSLPQAQEILSTITERFHIHFIIPQNAEYATAIGAAIYHIKHGV